MTDPVVGPGPVARAAGYREVRPGDDVRANRSDWDAYADEYQSEHGAFLGDTRFIWCPEGLDEADARLLGDVSGRRVLEIGCGAAQCSRWLSTQGADAVGIDQSHRQLQHARRIDDDTGIAVPVAGAEAGALPFADGTFDVVCSAFGAFPFLVDVGPAFAEVARVLRAGGRFVCSVTHPVRWMFPDDPSVRSTTVVRSYFASEPYVETADDGRLLAVEAHRTLGQWIDALRAAGLVLSGLLEPPWPDGLDRVWGGWGPERGRLVPGTLILSAHRAG